MKILKVRVILILLMFLHAGIFLHAETPTYTAKPLHTTSGSSVYSKGRISSTTAPGGTSVGNLAVPMGGGVGTTTGSSTFGGGFSSTSSYFNSGSRANLSFGSTGNNYSIGGESHSGGVSRRRVSEDDHPLDPAMEPIGEIPFIFMILVLFGYLVAVRKRLMINK